MNIYALMMIVIVPTFICFIINIILYIYARSSTRRVHPNASPLQPHSKNAQQPKISGRDLRLLRQILIMFFLFACGWTPVYLILVFRTYIFIPAIVVSIFSLIATWCLLADLINMLVFDRQLRERLQNRILQPLQAS